MRNMPYSYDDGPDYFSSASYGMGGESAPRQNAFRPAPVAAFDPGDYFNQTHAMGLPQTPGQAAQNVMGNYQNRMVSAAMLPADLRLRELGVQHNYDMQKLQAQMAMRGEGERMAMMNNERNRMLQLETQRRGFDQDNHSTALNYNYRYGL